MQTGFLYALYALYDKQRVSKMGKKLRKKSAAAAALILAFSLIFSGCTSGGSDVQQSSLSSDTEEISAEQSERLQKLSEDAENGLFVLINKQNSVEQDYCPEDLAPIAYYALDRDPQWRFMREEAALRFDEMVEAAREDGIDFVMTTAYRSYAFQSILWDNAVARYGSEESANNMVARPGESEHQSGLAVDVSSAENDYQLNENFGDTEAGKWIAENAASYGFILRYTEDKTDITGYGFEPWHLRYVGETAASEITEQGIALEEYIVQLAEQGII